VPYYKVGRGVSFERALYTLESADAPVATINLYFSVLLFTEPGFLRPSIYKLRVVPVVKPSLEIIIILAS